MKSDPEYADAVSRLRVRSCTEQDVDMFNSCIIKSEEHPKGIDMSVEPYINSTRYCSSQHEKNHNQFSKK